MEEAQKIFQYLPITPPDDEYIRFLWETFETNYKTEKFQFAFIAYHMLFMCFVYYQIAKLYKVKPEECKDLMIFTGKIQDHIDKHERKISAGEESLLAPLQKFSLENERTIMGLFLTIKCTRTEIKSFKEIVDSRNSVAHSNGNIFYKSKESIDDKIDEIFSCIDTIQLKSTGIIEKAYNTFLLDSSKPEEREFFDDESQIKEIFVHGNYLSLEDVKIAQKWNIAVLSKEIQFKHIKSLSETLLRIYQDE